MTDTRLQAPFGSVDKTLVAMFLKLTPEERLKANDNTARTILDLRDAFNLQKQKESESKRHH